MSEPGEQTEAAQSAEVEPGRFTDPRTGKITDLKEAFRQMNQATAEHTGFRGYIEGKVETVDETCRGPYLYLLIADRKRRGEWEAMQGYAERAEALHVKLDDPAWAAASAVYQAEALAHRGEHDQVFAKLNAVREYLSKLPELPAGTDEWRDQRNVVVGTREVYGDAILLALRGLREDGRKGWVADYCQDILEQGPVFEEEECALLLITVEIQTEAEDYAEAMATQRRLEKVSATFGRYDIAANAAFGQAATSLRRFGGMSAAADYRRGVRYLEGYAKVPGARPAQLDGLRGNAELLRVTLAGEGLL